MAFELANLPPVSSLSVALRQLEKDVGPAGSVILKMDKRGDWVFGADQTEVDDGTLWAVNPFSFVHGFIAWGDGEVLGEKMVSVSQPLPEMEPAPAGAKRGWETQVGMSLKCISGPDTGLEVRYNVTSVGGKRAVQGLAVAIAQQVESDQTKPVPVVTLKRDHYTHKSYGKIYTPVFEVQEWMSMDGKSEEKADEAAPARRRRAA
jgi:hypothetical protein